MTTKLSNPGTMVPGTINIKDIVGVSCVRVDDTTTATSANSTKMGGSIVTTTTSGITSGYAYATDSTSWRPQIILTTWNPDKLKQAVAQFYTRDEPNLHLSFRFKESLRDMENKFLDLRNRCEGLELSFNQLPYFAGDNFENLYGRLEKYDSTDEAIEVLLNAFIQYKLKQ